MELNENVNWIVNKEIRFYNNVAKGNVEQKLEKLRNTLQSKGLKLSRNKIEYMIWKFINRTAIRLAIASKMLAIRKYQENKLKVWEMRTSTGMIVVIRKE